MTGEYCIFVESYLLVSSLCRQRLKKVIFFDFYSMADVDHFPNGLHHKKSRIPVDAA